LLAIDTVASSKLHGEAADTTAEPDSKREETKLWRSLIVADFGKREHGAVNVARRQT
jgi:hypothetical protein